MSVDSPARILALSAQAASTTDDDIVVSQDVGGIAAGTFIASGTTYADLAKMLLGARETTVPAYLGASTTIPTSVTGLTVKNIPSTTLLNTEGYCINIKAGVLPDPTATPPVVATPQYPYIALPYTSTSEYTLNSWEVQALPYDIPHTRVIDAANGYYIWYLNTPSMDSDIGGCDYRFKLTYRES